MIFTTRIKAIDPLTNELKDWVGPDVEASSFPEAESYCRNNLGYCVVYGEKIDDEIEKAIQKIKSIGK